MAGPAQAQPASALQGARGSGDEALAGSGPGAPPSSPCAQRRPAAARASLVRASVDCLKQNTCTLVWSALWEPASTSSQLSVLALRTPFSGSAPPPCSSSTGTKPRPEQEPCRRAQEWGQGHCKPAQQVWGVARPAREPPGANAQRVEPQPRRGAPGTGSATGSRHHQMPRSRPWPLAPPGRSLLRRLQAGKRVP